MVGGKVKGVSVTNLQVPTSLRSICLWAAYPEIESHLERFSISAKQLKDIVVRIDAESGPCPKTALLFLLTLSFFLVLLPSLS